MTAFDVQVSQVVSRARFLERMLHDRGPWSAIVYTRDIEYRLPLDRAILPDEHAVILTGYMIVGRPMDTIEIYCRSDLVTARPLEGRGPCRIWVRAGIQAAEPVL